MEYVFGLARNRRLEPMIADELAEAKTAFRTASLLASSRSRLSTQRAGRAAPRGGQGRTSGEGANPRFIVTSLRRRSPHRGCTRRSTAQRGEMENRIKECQLDLYADRTSAATMRANQFRLLFAWLAYVLMEAVRRLGSGGTEMANATAARSA